MRLPDVVLRNGETLGALGPVDGFDLEGILSSDQALRIGGAEAADMHGKEVRVVLGSADADRLHWGHGTNLYYAIEWGRGVLPREQERDHPRASAALRRVSSRGIRQGVPGRRRVRSERSE